MNRLKYTKLQTVYFVSGDTGTIVGYDVDDRGNIYYVVKMNGHSLINFEFSRFEKETMTYSEYINTNKRETSDKNNYKNYDKLDKRIDIIFDVLDNLEKRIDENENYLLEFRDNFLKQAKEELGL